MVKSIHWIVYLPKISQHNIWEQEMDGKQRSHEAVHRWTTYLERQGKSPLTREA